ncbi:MAG: hypothetical protein L0027_10410, partial [Candidatus Rokubacteria bacterium]|nr:hypothetical protein [Candidatus Rokubacteria bacterium]
MLVGMFGQASTSDGEDQDRIVTRRRRPWALIAASLMLAGLAAVLGVKWSEGRSEARQLRTELRQVYTEAEDLRNRADIAERRVRLLDQQVRTLTAEREQVLKRVESPPRERAKPKAPAPASKTQLP